MEKTDQELVIELVNYIKKAQNIYLVDTKITHDALVTIINDIEKIKVTQRVLMAEQKYINGKLEKLCFFTVEEDDDE